MKQRPISPHLSIYKPMITSSSSIIGRFCGVYLYIISALIIICAAISIQKYQDSTFALNYIITLYNSGIILKSLLVIFVFLTLFAFYFYLLAVIRHLIWDFGYLLDLKKSKTLGWLMFTVAPIASILTTVWMLFL